MYIEENKILEMQLQPTPLLASKLPCCKVLFSDMPYGMGVANIVGDHASVQVFSSW